VSTLVNAFLPRPKEVGSVLIVKLDEIGDMIYTLHCIEAIADQFPKATIDVYCKSMNNALVDQTRAVTAIVNDPHNLQTRYDIQIDFRGNWQTMQRALLGKCSRYFDRGSVRLQNKFNGGQKHEIETNQETVQALFPESYQWSKPKLHITEDDQESVRGLTAKYGISQYGLKTLLIGSPNEHDLNQLVADQCNNAINIAGETGLMQLAAVMRQCDFFVGNESGPLHFAIVEKKPLVALFGPGVKDVFYPLYPNQKVIHHMNDQLTEEDKISSMLKISEQEVVAAFESLSLS
jgi:ADP-heptose:LPS heptosyltransferase